MRATPEDTFYELNRIIAKTGKPEKAIVLTKTKTGFANRTSERSNADRSILLLITDADAQFLNRLMGSHLKSDIQVFGYGLPLPDPGRRIAALMVAAADGDVVRISRLLAEGADVNCKWSQEEIFDRGSTPLMVAAWRGRLPAVELLIEKGARIDATDYSGRTALHHAAGQ